jgi:hypothetical protein
MHTPPPQFLQQLVRKALLATIVCASITLSAQASPVLAPTEQVAGRSQLEWVQNWWQWALSFPADKTPLTDTTGTLANERNDGPVYFVNSSSGGAATSVFTAPANRPMLFPLVTTAALELPGPVPGCLDEPSPISCTLAGLASFTEVLVNPYARLDGIDLIVGPMFRQTSTDYFDMVLPANSVFGLDAGFYPKSLATDGYWVTLSGLAPGQHVLEFGGGDGTGFYAEMRSEITAVPAPSTLALSLLSLGIFYRCQKRQAVHLLGESRISAHLPK